MGRRGKSKSETLTSDDVVVIVKTRFIDLAEMMPSSTISVVLGGHSLEIDLHLSSDEMRKLASFFTNGAKWVDDQQGKNVAPPLKAEKSRTSHLKLL